MCTVNRSNRLQILVDLHHITQGPLIVYTNTKPWASCPSKIGWALSRRQIGTTLDNYHLRLKWLSNRHQIRHRKLKINSGTFFYTRIVASKWETPVSRISPYKWIRQCRPTLINISRFSCINHLTVPNHSFCRILVLYRYWVSIREGLRRKTLATGLTSRPYNLEVWIQISLKS